MAIDNGTGSWYGAGPRRNQMNAKEKFTEALRRAMLVNYEHGGKRYNAKNVDQLATRMVEVFLEKNTWYDVMGLACAQCGIWAKAKSVRIYLFSDIEGLTGSNMLDQEFRPMPTVRELEISEL